MNTHCCYKFDFYQIDLFYYFKVNKRPTEFILALHKANSYGKSGCSQFDGLDYLFFCSIFFR